MVPFLLCKIAQCQSDGKKNTCENKLSSCATDSQLDSGVNFDWATLNTYRCFYLNHCIVVLAAGFRQRFPSQKDNNTGSKLFVMEAKLVKPTVLAGQKYIYKKKN
ncbi:hypothetical protein ILYODFUR_009872 [Ilyodon furcidens]|uniref:Uncharacterized protein n=1 Tax=Ilyodon furcidens TaxID=33524 RepID=A0ABV0UQL2_9TELE